MKAEETHKLSDQEIQQENDRLHRQLYELRSKAVSQKLEKPHQIGQIRQDIARLLTEKRMRQIKSETPAKA